MRMDNTPKISRRSVAVGAAWSVPAVAAASAAPSFAVSPPASGEVYLALTGSGTEAGQFSSAGLTQSCPSSSAVNPNGTFAAGHNCSNPAPYYVLKTSVPTTAAGGPRCSANPTLITHVRLVEDGTGGTVASLDEIEQPIGFVTGQHSWTDSRGVTITATTTCTRESTAFPGTCVEADITWPMQCNTNVPGDSGDTAQNMPIRLAVNTNITGAAAFTEFNYKPEIAGYAYDSPSGGYGDRIQRVGAPTFQTDTGESWSGAICCG